ncbi:hypothetical protein KYC5002_22335 [Archangium violaceum]|uniref:hypothetical protein n=1 Tax=Archangium violaceum TaxID=83451 RepID=UPI002B2F3481|nr:hypothetical protein KYC5002_22335 [Archangium gephyra]
MNSLLGVLGTLFFMFLILAATVEVILELFRGTLERFGITWAKGKVSLDDSLKLASEFAPNNTELNTRLQAVRSAAEQIKDKVPAEMTRLATLEQKLTAVDAAGVNAIAGELNGVAASIKVQLEQSERQRIFILRALAAVVGCLLAWRVNFYVFQILASSPEAKDWLSTLKGLQSVWLNVLVGGLAAAAGSSYWHDQLDKIRNLKSAVAGLK